MIKHNCNLYPWVNLFHSNTASPDMSEHSLVLFQQQQQNSHKCQVGARWDSKLLWRSSSHNKTAVWEHAFPVEAGCCGRRLGVTCIGRTTSYSWENLIEWKCGSSLTSIPCIPASQHNTGEELSRRLYVRVDDLDSWTSGTHKLKNMSNVPIKKTRMTLWLRRLYTSMKHKRSLKSTHDDVRPVSLSHPPCVGVYILVSPQGLAPSSLPVD